MYRECFCTADPLYADMELDECCYGPHADRCFRPNPQYYGPRWHQFPRLHKHYPGEYRPLRYRQMPRGRSYQKFRSAR